MLVKSIEAMAETVRTSINGIKTVPEVTKLISEAGERPLQNMETLAETVRTSINGVKTLPEVPEFLSEGV